MEAKLTRENRKLIVKHVSGKIIDESYTPINGRVIVNSKTGNIVASKSSAILVVETKRERMRTIREYEKQRDVLRSAIAR